MAITAEQQGYIDEIREAASIYQEAENFFEGRVEEIYASPKVRRLLAKSGLNDLDAINFAKIPCLAIANRLEITSVSASGVNGENLSEQIGAIWDRNLMGFFTPDVHLKTSYLGDYYVIVWPVRDEFGNIDNVDIRVNSPLTTRVFYDPEDPLVKAVAAKVWSYIGQHGTESRVNFYYKDRIERYVTAQESDGKGKHPEDWVRSVSDPEDPESWLVANEWDEVPVFHHRTDFPYGIPDNRDAYVPQILINKLVISHASTIDFQNFPQRYFLTDPEDDSSFGGADSDADFPQDEDDDPESPFNSSKFRADPGEVWISTARSAGQFAAAGVDTFIAPFNRYVLAMSQVTETPMHEFDPSGQPPSGESLKVAEAPLVNRCNRRKLLEGSAWNDMWGFVLELMGHPGASIVVSWRNSASNPGPQDWDLAEKKLAMGVPRETVLAEMGYKPDDIAGWTFGPANWLTPDKIISLVEAGVLTAGPELENWLRSKDVWNLPAHPENAPYGRFDASDLDYGTVLPDERRAILGLAPLPDGKGMERATAAASESGGGGAPGVPGANPFTDAHTARLQELMQNPDGSPADGMVMPNA